MNIRFFLPLLSYSLIFSSVIFSQSIDSTLHSGNWSDPAIWSTGALPSSTDRVIINHYVHLDMDVTLNMPGTLFISVTGELCGDYNFTGSFTHYGPIKVASLTITDTSYSYGHFMTTGPITVLVSGTFWEVSPPGYGCTGCPFTCTVKPPIADFGNSRTICEGETIQFVDMSADNPTAWSWSFPGGTPSVSIWQNPVIKYSHTGIYNVSLIVNNPLGSDTITKTNYITVLPSPTVTVSADVSINYGDTATLVASGGGPYLWSTGDTSSSIDIHPSDTTTYSVLVTSANGCSDVGYVTVNIEPCPPLFIPNAFSPNGDGENDFLQLYNSNEQCVTDVFVQIFDRWGAKVFQSSDRNFQWDGTFQSQQLNSGVYVYHLTVKTFGDKVVNREGNVSLIR
jgi:gliding motility-associated-like protein